MVEGITAINTTQTKVQNPNKTQENKEKENKTKNFIKNNKTLISASAAVGLAGITIGAILYHNNKKLVKEINNLASSLKKNLDNVWANDENYKKFFDPEIAKQHIDKALGIKGNKAKLKELKDIKKYKELDRALLIDLAKERLKIEELPENIQNAIKAKDHIEASKLYSQYLDTLFHDSKKTGKTIAQTIENIFGKDSVVKPHTYDISKEYDVIATNNYTSGSGYQMTIVNRQNKIADRKNWEAGKELSTGCYSVGVVGHMPEDYQTPLLQQGIYKGRKYVSMSYGPESNESPSFGFTLFAPKGQSTFTPAQQDLWSIDTSKITKEDMQLINKLPRDDRNSNYDGTLSLVQYLANKYKA